MRISPTFVEWGRSPVAPNVHFYYASLLPSWQEKGLRFWGFRRLWYDCPHVSFGLWYFVFSWSTYYTLPPFDFMSEECKTRWERRPMWLRRFLDLASPDTAG